MPSGGERDASSPVPLDPVRAVLDLLGLAARAGSIVVGVDRVRKAARDGKVRRVILASDAAEGQVGKLVPLLEARRIPYHHGFGQSQLGAALGRDPVSAVGISNVSLERRVAELIAALPSSQD
jgi:ribosomal protein L7Ae-like RNA K-turn-binding protein